MAIEQQLQSSFYREHVSDSVLSETLETSDHVHHARYDPWLFLDAQELGPVSQCCSHSCSPVMTSTPFVNLAENEECNEESCSVEGFGSDPGYQPSSVFAYLFFEDCSLDDVGQHIASYGIDTSTIDIDSHAGEIGDKSDGSWLAISG